MPASTSEDASVDRGLDWAAPDPLEIRVPTPRLLIRAYELDDAPMLYETVKACRADLLPWMAWARATHRELAETTQWVSTQVLSQHEPASIRQLAVGIFEQQTGMLIGGTGFHEARRETASCETGYWVHPGHRGQGYCTEAMKHMLSFLLRDQQRGGMGFHRVRIFCSSETAASQRIPTKLGLQQEVHQRGEEFVAGLGVSDRLGWGVLAGEWDDVNHRRAE
jgi:RimJ/RimL family protein N-acetyltransferase